MHFLDWTTLLVPLLAVLLTGVFTQKYIRSVADFMSGGRLAGRYLLANGKGEMQAGAVTFVASFEMISQSGFSLTWWGHLIVPMTLLVSILGFVIYRYRETRAMTLGQFFEIRYSRFFRLFMGGLGFVAGILNFGIIPAVGARFLVYFLGLPVTLNIFSISLPTYIPLMALLLIGTTLLALSGGLITVMMTSCIEGIMAQFCFLIIIVALLMAFSWHQTAEVLLQRPPGRSMLNPFARATAQDCNLRYGLMTDFFSN